MASGPGGQLLAGLVSDEAASLYDPLLHTGGLCPGSGPDEVDLDSAPARELLDAQIARPSAHLGGRLIAVAERIALQLLLARQQAEIVASHERMKHGRI